MIAVQAEGMAGELLKIALKAGLLSRVRQTLVSTPAERAARVARKATSEVQSTAKDVAKAKGSLPVGKPGVSPELQLQLMKMKSARGL